MKLCEMNYTMSTRLYETETVLEDAMVTESEASQYQNVKQRIFVKLLNTEKNKCLLETLPHEPMLDLSLVFYMYRDNDPEKEEILITNEMLKQWKVDYFQLFEDAFSNTRQVMGACIRPLREMIGEMIEDISFDMKLQKADDMTPMYVLTNRWKRNGAVCILFWDMVMDLAEKLESDLLVIPSSIHEVILIPDGQGISVGELNRLIQSVNESELNPKDVLADHAYRFPRKEGRLMMETA